MLLCTTRSTPAISAAVKMFRVPTTLTWEVSLGVLVPNFGQSSGMEDYVAALCGSAKALQVLKITPHLVYGQPLQRQVGPWLRTSVLTSTP